MPYCRSTFIQMSNPELLLEQYNKIIAGQSTELIREGEQTLLKLERLSTFLADNTAVLCEPTVPPAVKRFAVLNLANHSKRLVKEKSIGRCEGTLQHYLSLLGNSALEVDLRGLLVGAVEVLLSCEHFKGVQREFVKEYVRWMNEAVGKEDAGVDFLFLAFCGQSLFTKENYSEETKELIKATILPLLQLTARMASLAAAQTLDNRDLFLAIARVLKEYSVLAKLYFKRLLLLDVESMKVLYLQELEQLLSSIIALNYPQNVLASSVYIQMEGQEQLSRLFNTAKGNFMGVMTIAVRSTFTFTKHPNMLASSPLYNKVPQILSLMIRATSGLLAAKPYYQHSRSIMLLESLDEALNFFTNCLRANSFYLCFFENKLEMLERIILPCLSLTPGDIDNFYEDSDQFVHSTLQVVMRDLRSTAPPLTAQETTDEVQQFQTLRTIAAEFLSAFCKYQDGTLSHVIDFAVGVLKGQHEGDKTLMFLLISILSTHFKDRKDLNGKVVKIIQELIDKCPIPVVTGNRKLEDLEYAYLLLTLSRVFFYSIEDYPGLVGLAYKVGVAVIQSPSCSDVHKYFVFDLFTSLAKVDEGQAYARDLLGIYNHLLKSTDTPSIHLLDSYFFLVKYNPQELKQSTPQLIEGLRQICLHIEREINKPDPVQILVSKEWNIIRQVGESEDFLPAMVQPIQELILPLLPYIDGTGKVSYEQDVLMLLTSFIDKGKRVTPNQQRIFEIIPKIFYSQYHCRFGHSFHTIQLFIFYGSELLANNLPALHALTQMALTSIAALEYKGRPRPENENCEGVLVLQSLVLKCGAAFPADLWSAIIKAVMKRLQQTTIKYHLLSSNLYALLSLALVHSHRFFSNEENEVLMAKIISQMGVFSKVQYSPKVIIAGLTELLVLSECEFVGRRFTQLLDIVITMLQITSSKRESYFNEQQADEEKEYANSIIMLKNDLKNLDEFAFFRGQVDKLKAKNLPLLQRSVKDLPKTKKDFFSHILRIERVANEPRQIYRIKR